jgi:hypothetical protein
MLESQARHRLAETQGLGVDRSCTPPDIRAQGAPQALHLLGQH